MITAALRPNGLVGIELAFELNFGCPGLPFGNYRDIENQRFAIGNRGFADVIDASCSLIWRIVTFFNCPVRLTVFTVTVAATGAASDLRITETFSIARFLLRRML